MAGAVQVEEHLQEQLSDHFHYKTQMLLKFLILKVISHFCASCHYLR